MVGEGERRVAGERGCGLPLERRPLGEHPRELGQISLALKCQILGSAPPHRSRSGK